MSRLFTMAVAIALLATFVFGTTAIAAKPKCGGLKATIVGTNGADKIYGTAKRDVIVAKAGADKIYGRGGKDVICSGNGKDVVYGGRANDKIYGGSHRDKLYGGSGNDRLLGQKGWDRIDGGGGNDVCYRGSNGAQVVACEKPDVRVSIATGVPSTAVHGEYFAWGVRLDNTGPGAVTVNLQAKNSFGDVICGTNIQVKEDILVGDGGTIFWGRMQRCQVDGLDPWVKLEVTLAGDFADVRGGNNSVSHTITIIGGP